MVKDINFTDLENIRVDYDDDTSKTRYYPMQYVSNIKLDGDTILFPPSPKEYLDKIDDFLIKNPYVRIEVK